MDPNIQVAFISVLATLVTTSGVIIVALLNSRAQQRVVASDAEREAALDDRQVVKQMLTLISENERKEQQIQNLNKDRADLRRENRELRAEIAKCREKQLEEEKA